MATNMSGYGTGQSYDPATGTTSFNYNASMPLWGGNLGGFTFGGSTSAGSGSSNVLSEGIPSPLPASSLPGSAGGLTTRTTTTPTPSFYTLLKQQFPDIQTGYTLDPEAGIQGTYTLRPGGPQRTVNANTMSPLDYLVMSAAYGTPTQTIKETGTAGEPGYAKTSSTNFSSTLPQIAGLFESDRAKQLGESFKPYGVGPGVGIGMSGMGKADPTAGTMPAVGSTSEAKNILLNMRSNMRNMWR